MWKISKRSSSLPTAHFTVTSPTVWVLVYDAMVCHAVGSLLASHGTISSQCHHDSFTTRPLDTEQCSVNRHPCAHYTTIQCLPYNLRQAYVLCQRPALSSTYVTPLPGWVTCILAIEGSSKLSYSASPSQIVSVSCSSPC